jgi:hypothetical protein
MKNMVSSIILPINFRIPIIFVLLFFFIEVNLLFPSRELIKGQGNIEISAYISFFYSGPILFLVVFVPLKD